MGLRNLTSFIFPLVGREPSTCEACGQEFECGASLKGCWCGEVKLDDSAREQLRALYRRCLCRACLERFASAQTPRAETGPRRP